MPDLYAINLYLQERLERDWLDEVRAVEAARWLAKEGLLPDRKKGSPLRDLLRAGRIAGQEQRPNKKNASWIIRRLAKSRNPHAIRQARERMRRYLPIDRDNLPADWPVNQGAPAFWQELGKTVAAFGYLEHILASTCYVLLATADRAASVLDESDKALSEWYNRVLRSRVDSMHRLTLELDRVLSEDSRVPHAVRKDLGQRLKELRPWRNALCHGAWLGISEDGTGHLEHFYLYEGVPVALEPKFTLKDLSDIRVRTVDTTIRIAEAASIAGPEDASRTVASFALATVLPRKYEPRNTPPEQE